MSYRLCNLWYMWVHIHSQCPTMFATTSSLERASLSLGYDTVLIAPSPVFGLGGTTGTPPADRMEYKMLLLRALATTRTYRPKKNELKNSQNSSRSRPPHFSKIRKSIHTVSTVKGYRSPLSIERLVRTPPPADSFNYTKCDFTLV